MAEIINVKKVRSTIYGECSDCKSHVDPLSHRNYCGNCGAKIKWDKKDIQKQNELIEYDFAESLKDEDWYDDWIGD